MSDLSARLWRALAVLVVLAGAGLVADVSPANAASYAKGVYAPYQSGGSIEGWADVNTNCEDTYGCWTYVKMERLTTGLVVNNWEYKGGYWASPGWNRVGVPIQWGCAYWRMMVESYNDSPSNSVLGINLGIVQINLGGGVKRYYKAYDSSSVRICPVV